MINNPLEGITLKTVGGVALSKINPSTVSECIMVNEKFAIDESQRLYYYDGTVYKLDKGHIRIRQWYHKVLEVHNMLPFWSNLFPAKIVDYITPRVPQLLDRPDIHRINLLNGIYYIGDLESVSSRFESHAEFDHSDYLTTVQIPINYDPLAICPYWDEFLPQLFPADPELLVQIVGLCMIPFTGLQKCIVLLGGGSNGKGTYLNAIQSAVGPDNYASLDMKRLTGRDSRFNTAGLVGKLVNIFGDLPPNQIEDKGIFKALTGQDSIQVEFKGKQPYSYKPFARLIFSCNSIMESDDQSVGYKRRFFCIPFEQTFDVDPKKGRELEQNLADPLELSGLFNRIVRWLPIIIADNLKYNDAALEIVQNFIPVPQYFKDWFEQSFIVDDGFACTEIGAFNSYTTSGIPAGANRDNMYAMLKLMCPSVKKAIGTAGEGTRYVEDQVVYVGLHLIKSNEKVIDRVHYYKDSGGSNVIVRQPRLT